MNNEYLHIEGNYWSYCDGVFSGCATLDSADDVEAFCLDRAEQMRHSTLGNYNHLSKEQREELARRWEAIADLPQGRYDYYFNLEDKYETFSKYVKDLAKKLGIKYELIIKK